MTASSPGQDSVETLVLVALAELGGTGSAHDVAASRGTDVHEVGAAIVRLLAQGHLTHASTPGLRTDSGPPKVKLTNRGYGQIAALDAPASVAPPQPDEDVLVPRIPDRLLAPPAPTGPRLLAPPKPPDPNVPSPEALAARSRAGVGFGSTSRPSSPRRRRSRMHPGLKPSRRQVSPARVGRLATTILLIVAAFVAAGFAVTALRSVEVTVSGVTESAHVRPQDLVGEIIAFTVSGGDVTRAELFLNDQRLAGVQRFDDRVTWVAPEGIIEGNHTLKLVVPRRLYGDATIELPFTVDGTPPVVDLPAVHEPATYGEPFTLRGGVEANVTLVINQQPIDTSLGTVELTFDRPPKAPLNVVATDAAGNSTQMQVVVPVELPRTTGVHVTAAAWEHDGLREGVLDLVRSNMITAVQLDLKDESGRIGYASDIELARSADSIDGRYDLAETIAELHELGVRVIGRIVAFRDPVLTEYAVRTGNLNWVLQTPDGRPLSNYNGFTNFNHDVVRQYNLDIAREAAEAGIDDILWDYMRRPEGDLSQIVVPGFDGEDPSPVIVSFVADAGALLRPYDVLHGVSVFGISARRGEYIAQDVVGMSNHVDYVSPMVYPSHWGPGEYGVTNPEGEPYAITHASLRDFQEVLDGTGTAIVPWLQDFTMRVSYGAKEVRAQINAAADLGIDDWLLWDPTVTYTEGAFGNP